MKKERLVHFLFALAIFLLILQTKLVHAVWLKYTLILFFMGFSTYYFFYQGIYTVIKRSRPDWIDLAISGLILSWTAAVLVLYLPVDSHLIMQLLKVLGIINYVFSFSIIFLRKEHSLALIHLITAILISGLT